MGSSQTSMPNYHQKMSVLKLRQTACVMVPAFSMVLHLWEWLLATGVESNGHATSWPCTLGTDEENINLVQGKVFSLSLSLSPSLAFKTWNGKKMLLGVTFMVKPYRKSQPSLISKDSEASSLRFGFQFSVTHQSLSNKCHHSHFSFQILEISFHCFEQNN